MRSINTETNHLLLQPKNTPVNVSSSESVNVSVSSKNSSYKNREINSFRASKRNSEHSRNHSNNSNRDKLAKELNVKETKSDIKLYCYYTSREKALNNTPTRHSNNNVNNAYCYFTRHQQKNVQKNTATDLQKVQISHKKSQQAASIPSPDLQPVNFPFPSHATIVTMDIFAKNNDLLNAPHSSPALHKIINFCTKKVRKLFLV